MKEVIWGLLVFVLTFLINYFIIYKLTYYSNINKKKKGKKSKTKELDKYVGFSYLIPKFKLDIERINIEYMFLCTSLINAFIIAFVVTVIFMLPWEMAFSLLLGFVLLFGLIYALYELFGRILVKKGWQKE